ncbi:hypothetical protein JB92DRAFT_2835574 [Gautieria morchelliformis]|nr:hypothetical protein JB92DRAFT_2835574 [Gautieria morchelliformis]
MSKFRAAVDRARARDPSLPPSPTGPGAANYANDNEFKKGVQRGRCSAECNAGLAVGFRPGHTGVLALPEQHGKLGHVIRTRDPTCGRAHDGQPQDGLRPVRDVPTDKTDILSGRRAQRHTSEKIQQHFQDVAESRTRRDKLTDARKRKALLTQGDNADDVPSSRRARIHRPYSDDSRTAYCVGAGGDVFNMIKQRGSQVRGELKRTPVLSRQV